MVGRLGISCFRSSGNAEIEVLRRCGLRQSTGRPCTSRFRGFVVLERHALCSDDPATLKILELTKCTLWFNSTRSSVMGPYMVELQRTVVLTNIASFRS